MMQAPFAYHGGKSIISPLIWQCLGNPNVYVEPFGGTLANLLARPISSSRALRETVGDADCMITHFWRAVRHDPGAVAWYTVGPVTNVDLQTRHNWLVSQRQSVEERMADPNWYDAKIAGWWAWGQNLIVSGRWCGRWPKLTTSFAWSKTCNRVRQFLPNELAAYYTDLSVRLRNVALVQGDWQKTLDIGLRRLSGVAGILFDPPYSGRTGRTGGLYAVDSLTVADEVADWCRLYGQNKNYRIAICGFKGEHDLPGWRCFEWENQGGKSRRALERIWFSEHCLVL